MHNAAIYYEAEGYSTSGEKLMGRNAAGEAFLRGFVQHANIDCVHAAVVSQNSANAFTQQINGWRKMATKYTLSTDFQALSNVGCLYYPAPGLSDMSRLRMATSARAYSICGITHTTSSARAMKSVCEIISAPVMPWDALICTSYAVRDSLRYLLEAEAEHLRQHIGAQRFSMPQMPVIPLGVHQEDFTGYRKVDNRMKSRKSLQIGDDDVAVLFVGRLSFHGKANPLQMYRALEDIANETGKKIHMIHCGWFGNDSLKKSFLDSAALFAPSLKCHWLDGRIAVDRATAWGAGDIFSSLSDNIQETFGLTPVEAMAAGMPCVVTDWNGYRQTVRDGVDGYRVATIGAPAVCGADLALQHAGLSDSYDIYIGKASMFCAVDYRALRQAYKILITDKNKRKTMGESAAKHVSEVFDWRHIIARYQELWGELALIRATDPDLMPARTDLRNPHALDPFHLYRHYPTFQLSDDCLVGLIEGQDLNAFIARAQSPLISYVGEIFSTKAELAIIFDYLGDNGPSKASDLLPLVPGSSQIKMARTLVACAKLEVFTITPPKVA